MARHRFDQFLNQLIRLMENFPEHAPLLKPLIEQLSQGKAARVKAKLEELKEEDWH